MIKLRARGKQGVTACESEEDDYVTPAQKNRREGRSVLPTGQSPHRRRNEYKADRVEDVYFGRGRNYITSVGVRS